MRSRPVRSCTRCTAATATRASWTPTPPAAARGAMRRCRGSHERRAAAAARRWSRADAALELVPLGRGVRAGEGAHFLPRVAVRGARRGARRSRAPTACSTYSARACCCCATAQASCAPSTTSAGTAARGCAAMRPLRARAPRACRAGSRAGASPAPITSGPTISTVGWWRRRILPVSRDFDKGQFSLYPVGVECWGGFVFLNLTPAQAAPLAAAARRHAGSASRAIRSRSCASATRSATRSRPTGRSICENYNECYHCAGVHPELCERGAGVSRARRRQPRLGARHRRIAPAPIPSPHRARTRRRAFPTLDADERVRHKGELVYPNLFLSLACDHAAVFILQPRSADAHQHRVPFSLRALRAGEGRLRSTRHQRRSGTWSTARTGPSARRCSRA